VNAIYALYARRDEAQQAINLLECEGARLGVDPRKIEVLSSLPLEECDVGRRETASRMPWLAALGGVAGGTATYLFVTSVQRAFPIITGGMSVTPIWTNGILVYEMTMLGAIFTTLVTLLLAARLPSWHKRLYDPAVSDGLILVGVIHPPKSSLAGIENIFRQTRATAVKTD
jgi:ActD protein